MSMNDSVVHLKDTTTFFDGTYTAESCIITICDALAIYNALELLLLIFTTFRRYKGLYFWSLLVASAGVIPYTIGFMILYFQLTAQLAGQIITTVGWPMMITGQSFVLYSRLSVVLGPTYQNVLRGVKWMIIIDGAVFHLVTSIVMFGAYNARINHPWAQAYKYVEKVQMTGFTVQEFIISGLYMWRAVDILKTSTRNRRRNRIMHELFFVNVLIVIMDIALLIVEYQNRHVIEQALKEVVYSVKLKLEFAILSKLVSITQKTEDGASLGPFETSDVDPETKEQQNANLTIPPFQTNSTELEKASPKADTVHIERACSWLSDTTYQDERSTGNRLQSLRSGTSDEHRRRRTLEDDLYANASRDIGG